MCGICGFIKFDNEKAQEAPIREMMRIQKHRGPDDEGVFVEDNVGLGFVRLSILDLSPAGHQPMYSRDGRFVVVFNGEIFNYVELRDELKKHGYEFSTGTDTEVLLAAYQHWGEDCLNRFNGMWAFVVYDRVQKKIFIARDRYGIKPLYYYLTDHFFAFASEIPPLLSLLPGKPSPDNQSIFDYLVFNRTDQTERTFFNEIKKLQHGHSFIISLDQPQKPNPEQLKMKRWYNLREKVTQNPGFAKYEDYRELFSDAIKLRLRSDVPVGVCLSGGLDSSAIVSVLLKDFQKYDLNTFSAVYNKGQTGDESEFIAEYSSLLKNMYYTTPTAQTLLDDMPAFVKAHAEPIPSTSPYAQFKVMELAKKNVVVTLDGQGADEELAGYHYFFGFFYKDLLRKAKLFKLTNEMYKYITIHRSSLALKSFLYFLLPAGMRANTRVNEKGYLHPEFVNSYRDSNEVSSNIYGSSSLNEALIDHFEFKLEHLLKWEDRNSMWFSIEARVPFLDYRLVEQTLATSGDLIINDGMTKHILREAMKGTLPEKIRKRVDKVGFGTPQDEWFRTEKWEAKVMEVLNSQSFEERGIIDHKKAKEKYNQHLAGKINFSKEIWKWVNLEYWFRMFID
jgi:asparagine synthase (glutamine-hydrolysing)